MGTDSGKFSEKLLERPVCHFLEGTQRMIYENIRVGGYITEQLLG